MRKDRQSIAFRTVSLFLVMTMLMSVLFAGTASVLAASYGTDANLIPNGSFEKSKEPSTTVNAWKADAGFQVSLSGACEGGKMLTYAGTAEGTATSETITVKPNEEYILIAYLKREAASDIAKVRVNGVEAEVSSNDTGVWTEYRVKFDTKDLTELSVGLVAKGNVAFDGIQVAQTYTEKEIECVVNGSFDEEGGWDENLPMVDVTSIGGQGKAAGVAISGQTVAVDTNTWYLLSADIYRDNPVTWKYVDMAPLSDAIRIRGTKVNEWEKIGTLWYSGENKSTATRVGVEGGWDNVSQGAASNIGGSYIDNVSLKKVKVSDELVTDPDFTANGWKIESNGVISDIGNNDGKGSFQSTMTDASQGKAIALANNGKAIPVDKNSTYVLSAWVRVDGATRTLKTVLDMNDIDGELQIESTTYNHDSRGNFWVLVTGMWNSGDNTEVTLRAAIEPTNASGAVSTAYIDTVSFRKAQPAEYGNNLVTNGGFEDYITEYSVDNWSIPTSGISLPKDAVYGEKSVALTDQTMRSDSISLKKGKNYKLSGWIKRTSGSSSAKVVLGDLATLTSSKTGEWEYLSTTFKTTDTIDVTALLEATGTAQFDGLYLSLTDNVFDVEGSKLSANAIREEMSSADTSMIIAVDNDKMYVEKLLSKDTKHEWISPAQAQEMPLIPEVNRRKTNWKYVGSSIDTTDGKLLTITFKNAEPAMELKAYWQAYPGEEGPVQYWAELINNSGNMLQFKQKDIISSDLVVTADSEAKLHYYERRSFTDGKAGDYTHCDDITAGYQISSEICNWSDNTGYAKLPYQVIETATGQGLYYGYSFGFGNISVEAGDNPTKIKVNAVLSKTNDLLTRRVAAGDRDGDGKEDPDLNLIVPAMFFGTYKGSVDNGCNRMKDWFWNHRMTKTLRENKNEPLVEAHFPWNSEKEWTDYLNEYDVASWGVQLIKQDYWWTTPNSPPEDSSFNTELQQKYEPWPAKWPNGMTLGNLAHSKGVQLSLYFCDTYEGTALVDWAGRNKHLNAISSRLKNWNIDYFRSDFALQGPWGQVVRNYAGYEGFIWMIDQMIADEELPNFRYEHCAGGGMLKDFNTLQRLTFMTNEDTARAIANRALMYSDTYMINPAQLKLDLAIDWPPFEGNITDQEAYDYYVFRTGLLGAIMICGSTHPLTEQQIKVAKDTYALYNTKQRAILRNCDVYHILPAPNGVDWDGMEYFNEDLGMGSIMLYRPSSNCEYTQKYVYPDGLKDNATYEVTFEDNKDLNVTKTGAELMKNGILVRMDRNYDSEVIWLKELSEDEIEVEDITIYNATEIKAYQQHQLAAAVNPVNATNSEIEWTSSDEDIAMVSEKGVVTAWKPGEVTITATAKQNGVSDSVTIQVTEGDAKGEWTYVNNTDPAISYDAGSRPGGGGPGYYSGDETAIMEYAEMTFEGTKVKWLSAKNVDCGQAKVYIDGEFVADVSLQHSSWVQETVFESDELASGRHTIRIENVNKSIPPYVSMDALAYVPSIKAQTVRLTGDDFVAVGNTAQYTGKVLPSVVGNRNVVWSSSDESIATVDSTGKVTALAAGTVEIKAASEQDPEVFITKTISVEDAASVIAKIDAIGTVTLESKAAIANARAAYNCLTETQKAAVTKLKVLEDAEAKLQELLDDAAAAKAVNKLINAIGTVTLESEQAIKAARDAYDKLTAAQKELVTKLAVLEAAEAKWKDIVAAKAVDDMIAALNANSSEKAVKDARAAYEKLTAAQKDLVTKLADLVKLEEALKPKVTYGDVNNDGKIDAVDALMVLKAAVGKLKLNETETLAGDVNGDKKLDANDALLILKRAVNKIDRFPVEK